MPYVSYMVTIRLPEGATKEDGQGYIEEAVKLWAGSQPYGDPFFELDRESVDVTVAQKGDD